ncbi:hypothetical protein [Herbaspirillum huttiense]|uniref:hypothetical protein n=1 Tax=Herbaspirillum huttiense TaxID=863372 RepID=UPI0039AF6447
MESRVVPPLGDAKGKSASEPQRAKKAKVTAKMELEFQTLLATKGDRFRRSDLAKLLRPFTNPRSLQVADELAGIIMAKARKDGVIVSAGSVLWKVATRSRRTKAGRPLVELEVPVDIKVTTKVPEKWFALDAETADLWVADRAGKLARASKAQIEEAIELLKSR